jgi:adenylylsulfate kinase
VGKLFVEAGLIVLSAFISPVRSARQMVRAVFPSGEFIEYILVRRSTSVNNETLKAYIKK